MHSIVRYTCGVIFIALVGCRSNVTISTVSVAKGFSSTMVNATIFRRNAIVSHNGDQYVAFYDSSSYVTLAKRRIGSAQWQIKRTSFQGNTADAHNVISIMVDGDGYLHMAWDHHGHPLRYSRSVSSGSLEMQAQPMVGSLEEKVTYPEFYRLPDGDLLFVYRDGSSGNGNMVLNRYHLQSKSWSRVNSNLLDGEGTRNAYWQMCVSDVGSIHVSWVWRESFQVETNHDMGYAVSKDGGVTWQTSTGKNYALPITMKTSEYAWKIPERSNLINQTSMITDDSDHPYIATYFQAPSDSCPQYYVIYKNRNEWSLSRVTNRNLDFDLGGAGTRSIPISRPQLLYINKQLVMVYRDEEHQDRALMATAKLSDMWWESEEITDESLDRWEPSYDTELAKKGILHLYLQRVGQESGEKSTGVPPQMVSILEVVFSK